MNPFLWLVWGAVAVVILFVLSAVCAGIWDAVREARRCPECGYDRRTDTKGPIEPIRMRDMS